MRKTVKQRRREMLLAWVCGQYRPGYLTAERLTAAMTCEALPHELTPERFHKAITEFRHLRTDARVAACRAFLENRP